MKETSQKKSWWRRPASLWLLVAAGCAGILLIGLSEWIPTEKSTEAVLDDTYAEELEKRLTALVGSVAGVGRCRVMVTLENGGERVYAVDESVACALSEETGDGAKKSESESRDNSVVVAGGDGLLVSEKKPTVRGVAVVCEGGGSEAVRTAVQEAVATALAISTRRVCVLPLS